MKNTHKKILFGTAFVCMGAAFVFVVYTAKAHLASVEVPNQLAQIIAIETDLLKKWQEQGALKHTMSYDSEGSEVSLLQRMLSQDPGIYPEQKITGYFGDNTQAAVSNFQREYGLPITGEVDQGTMKKLNEIFLSSLCPQPSVIYPELLMRKISRTDKLPSEYVPPNLVEISKKVRSVGVACVRSDIFPFVQRMFLDAKADGVDLMITSAYRKPEIQKYLYAFWIGVQGSDAAEEIAEPGASEHQLGSAVDLTDASIQNAGVDPRFEKSAGGIWMKKNAYKYGFILSYPENKKQITGFSYEPWHWRFVGVAAASALSQDGLVYNEAHFDTVKPPQIPDPSRGIAVTAKAFISVYVDANGKETILLQKDKDTALPIASMTKLTVALVASEQHKKYDRIRISAAALATKGLSGIYERGQSFYFGDALHALLIASHNEMATSIASDPAFIEDMNAKASALGLAHTHFVNATGLDPSPGSELINESTVFDMYKLIRSIKETHPEILEITTQKSFDLKTADGMFVGTLTTTNKLLDDTTVPFKIIGGKTGETPRAKQNLVVVTEAPCDGEIISAVIGSEQSFDDMKQILQYDKNSFDWSCRK